MTKKILLVDDEPNVIQGFKRNLRSQFELDTALGGYEALETVISQGPYAVVVSDMQMPEMNGIQLLSRIKNIAPDTIRIMLTGNADQGTAVQAINEGNIFRFLTKPCSGEQLAEVLKSGIEHYRLIIAERELLEKTLNGSIAMLTDILSLYHPELFGRATQIREMIRKLSKSLSLPSSWDMEAACILSKIGYLGLPPDIFLKIQEDKNLSKEEESLIKLVPEIGGSLLANIPRLESVAKILLYQNKHFDGSGFPDDSIKGNEIPLEARILKVLSDLVEIEEMGIHRNQAIEQLQMQEGYYDPQVMNKVTSIFWSEGNAESEIETPFSEMTVGELKFGDVLKSDIKTSDGILLLKAGLRISTVQLERIKNCAKIRKIVEPILIERSASAL